MYPIECLEALAFLRRKGFSFGAEALLQCVLDVAPGMPRSGCDAGPFLEHITGVFQRRSWLVRQHTVVSEGQCARAPPRVTPEAVQGQSEVEIGGWGSWPQGARPR